MISQGPACSDGKAGAAFVRAACQPALCAVLPQSRLVRRLLRPAPTWDRAATTRKATSTGTCWEAGREAGRQGGVSWWGQPANWWQVRSFATPRSVAQHCCRASRACMGACSTAWAARLSAPGQQSTRRGTDPPARHCGSAAECPARAPGPAWPAGRTDSRGAVCQALDRQEAGGLGSRCGPTRRAQRATKNIPMAKPAQPAQPRCSELTLSAALAAATWSSPSLSSSAARRSCRSVAWPECEGRMCNPQASQSI